MTALLTVGHGTLNADTLAGLLAAAGVQLVVDVRRYPGSRRHPHTGREAMTSWLADTGLAYRWEPDLGGRRVARPGSPNTGLRNPQFRGYADHMGSTAFRAALERLLADAARQPAAVLCAETLWWRCHRRLLADAAVLLGGADVRHLGHDGRLADHELTPGVRRAGEAVLYDAGEQPTLPLG